MMADVAGMRSVRGSRMATPFAPPSPGNTPMIVPSVMPTTAKNRFSCARACWKPMTMFSNPIASVSPVMLERTLGHGDEEPLLEDDERDHRHGEGERDHGQPGVAAHAPHV